MLVDLLDRIEKLGSRIPVELHTNCKEYRSTMGLPANVRSKSNRKAKQSADPIRDGAAMAAQLATSNSANAAVPAAAQKNRPEQAQSAKADSASA
jgi:hypothetical protein